MNLSVISASQPELLLYFLMHGYAPHGSLERHLIYTEVEIVSIARSSFQTRCIKLNART